MSDYTLAEVFEIVYDREFAEYDNAPRHFFSRRHRKAMKEILYPGATPNTAPRYTPSRNIPIKRRVLIAVMIVVLLALGITVGASMSWGFTRKEHRDNTELFTVNAENAPKTIEYVYYLPDIPEGYVLQKQFPGEISFSTNYIDPSTNRTMTFDQRVKDGYNNHIDNERHKIEELDIGGKYAVYWGSENFGIIIWDNEDYVFEISGFFTKDEIIELAKSVKIKDEP